MTSENEPAIIISLPLYFKSVKKWKYLWWKKKKQNKIFCQWNSAGRRCLKPEELSLSRTERYIREKQAFCDSKSHTHSIAFEEHNMANKCLAKHCEVSCSLRSLAFTWGEPLTIQQQWTFPRLTTTNKMKQKSKLPAMLFNWFYNTHHFNRWLSS